MGGTGVIDRFLEVFTRYINSGFGLLNSEVAFLATTLVAIDITLAAIFWSWGGTRTSSPGWPRKPCLSASSPTSSATGTISPVSSSRVLPGSVSRHPAPVCPQLTS